ncbi:MAG: hypothetical protein RI906_3327, partial [Pseudomonadota bacterium]
GVILKRHLQRKSSQEGQASTGPGPQ